MPYTQATIISANNRNSYPIISFKPIATEPDIIFQAARVSTTTGTKKIDYYVPYTYTDDDKKDWHYFRHGHFNVVYRQDSGTPDNDFIKKFAFNPADPTDQPNRLARVGRRIHSQKNPEIKMYVDPNNAAFTMSFIPSKLNAAKQSIKPGAAEICKAMLEIFKNTKRIVVDAATNGNFIKRERDDAVLCVDFGFALLFADPDDLEQSQISLETWSYYTNDYVTYLDNMMDIACPSSPDDVDNNEYRLYQIARFTKALIFLAASRLKLKNPDTLLENTELVNELVDLFDLKKETLDDRFQALFTTESIVKFSERNAIITALAKNHSLSRREKQKLALSSAFEYDKNFIIRCSYFRISPTLRKNYFIDCSIEAREKFLTAYAYFYFNNQPITKELLDGVVRNPQPMHYHLYCDAMINLIERDRIPVEEARLALKGTSPVIAKIIGLCYRFGLRRNHLPLGWFSPSENHIELIASILKEQHGAGKKLSDAELCSLLSKSESVLLAEIQATSEVIQLSSVEMTAREALITDEVTARADLVGFFRLRNELATRAPGPLSDDFPDGDELDATTTPTDQLLPQFLPS